MKSQRHVVKVKMSLLVVFLSVCIDDSSLIEAKDRRQAHKGVNDHLALPQYSIKERASQIVPWWPKALDLRIEGLETLCQPFQHILVLLGAGSPPGTTSWVRKRLSARSTAEVVIEEVRIDIHRV